MRRFHEESQRQDCGAHCTPISTPATAAVSRPEGRERHQASAYAGVRTLVDGSRGGVLASLHPWKTARSPRPRGSPRGSSRFCSRIASVHDVERGNNCVKFVRGSNASTNCALDPTRYSSVASPEVGSWRLVRGEG